MWDAFCQLIASIFDGVYGLVHDWGVAIILVTIVFRLLLTPLMKSQARTSYTTQKLQPKIQALRDKYADDPTRLNEETQKIYAEAKFNPITGCLPMFLQMPIFVALFQVLRNIDEFIPTTEEFKFFGLVPDLLKTPGEMLENGFNAFVPYLILVLIFALATFIPMLLQQRNQDSKQRTQMLIMTGFMTLMMIWLGWNSPAGVLLFWGVSSIIAVAQQQIVMRGLKKKDAQAEEEIAEQQVVVDVERKTKKKRPKKKR